MNGHKRFPRWPMILLALPASVAIWGGWVGLGTRCGFGVVHPLPGLWGGFHLNLVLTLPIGVEAYGTYALAAWLWPGDIPARARRWAMYSALAALLLGCLGQVTYHLLMWSHAVRAPALVVVFVSCVPVAVVGAGGALYHLMGSEPDTPEVGTDIAEDMAEDGPVSEAPAGMHTALYRLWGESGELLYVGISNAPRFRHYRHAQNKEWWPEVRDKTITWFGSRAEALAAERTAIHTEHPKYNIVHNTFRPGEAMPEFTDLEDLVIAATSNGHGLTRDEVEPFAAEVAAGRPPGVAHIRKVLGCGQPRAQRVRDGLQALAAHAGNSPMSA